MRPSSLVVGLVDEFNPELVDGFRSALPPGTTLVENALDSTTLDQVDYLVHWMKDIPDAVLGKVPVLRGVVKLDSGSGAAPSGLDRRGITFGVATSPALISVAEHTVMLILAVFKRLGTAIDRTRAGQLATGVAPKLTTQEEYSYNWVGLEKFEAVFGKTIGLVGLGRIGVEVARMLRGFNTDVVYTKRRPLAPDQENELGVRFLPFDDLLRTAHCVSLHNRFDSTNEKMMGAREFSLMPIGSFFVNTARGRLVDEDALHRALVAGHLAGAALDVFWYEPPLPDSPLWTTPNLIMTPHSAGIPIAVSLANELAEAARLISGLETQDTRKDKPRTMTTSRRGRKR